MNNKKIYIGLIGASLIVLLIFFAFNSHALGFHMLAVDDWLNGSKDGNDDEHLLSFPDGRGGIAKIRTDHIDCYKPIFYGDQGEEVKLLQAIINGWLAYNEDARGIEITGRFGPETQQGLEWLDAWQGNDNENPTYGYAIFQFNTAIFIGDHAPCNWYGYN